MFKKFKRNLVMTIVGTFLMLLAFPVLASASSAITSFNVNRTTVNPGQTVIFTIRTTPEVNYVFADVDGVRVQGTLQSGVTWQLVATPNTTQTITVFANSTNLVAGAAAVSIPITVTGGVTQPPVTPPTTPATGNMAIHDISETTATRAGYVQLTVVTGVGANEVWAQFDNNRFRRAQEQTALRTATTRTWHIDFRPDRWVSQTVRVSANREYVVTGATTQNFVLTLTAPYVPATRPTIQSVTPNPRTVNPGGNTTFTIRTNLETNYVWVVDVDGNRRNASISGRAGVGGQNWTVTFAPGRTGGVRVYANTTNSATGAATRTEQITVQQQTAAIVGTPTAGWTYESWGGGRRVVSVEVTTNQFAEHVWVQLPGGTRHSLTRVSGSGTSNRTWGFEFFDVGNATSLQVHVSDVSGSWTSRDSRTVTITGQGHWSSAWVDMPSGSWVSNVHINSNGVMTFNTNQSHGTWGTWGNILVEVSGLGTVWASSTNGVNWTTTVQSGWWGLHNTSVSFTDHTGSGRSTTWGTLRWH